MHKNIIFSNIGYEKHEAGGKMCGIALQIWTCTITSLE